MIRLAKPWIGEDERRAVAAVLESGQLVQGALVERFEQEYGAEVGGRGDHIELRVREKHVSDLARAALGAGAELRSITPHRVSLESIFLSAVEGGAETPAPGERALGQEGTP